MVYWCFHSTIFHLSQTPAEISLQPIIGLRHAHSGRFTVGRFPQPFPPTLTSPLRESTVGRSFFTTDTQPQLDVGMPFLIDTEISSCSPPLALPECSTRWYSIVKSETVAAPGEEGDILCVRVCVCASVCLRVSSD